MRPKLILKGLLVLIFLSGCVNDSQPDRTDELNGIIIQNEQLLSEINTAPSEIEIEGVNYTIEAFTWINLMPSINLSKRLLSKNQLIRIDQNEIPDHIELIQQYVVNGTDIWVPKYDQDRPPNSIPYLKTEISRQGPQWEVGSSVNIGISVINKNTAEEYLLGLSDIIISSAS